MRMWISLMLKSIVVLASTTGIFLVVNRINVTYVGGVKGLLYFTNQSNIWIGVVCFIGIIIMVLEKIKQREFVKPWMYVVKLVFTVSISLTGVVFCFLLAPTIPDNPWNFSSVLTHIVVPFCSIADFIVYDYKGNYKYRHGLLTLLPPLYYLGFSGIGFVLNWDFGLGANYPYFFLNWTSPAGIFGFSKELPYFMGTFYWLSILLLFVLGLSFLYIFVVKKIKKEEKIV